MRITESIAIEMGCRYIYEEWGRVNLYADKLEIGDTLIVETLPTDGEIDTQFAPLVRTSRTAIFAFLKHCDLDFDGVEVGEIFEEMLNKAKAFVMNIDRAGAFEPLPSRLPYNAVLDFLDANMAGVRVTLTLKELEGVCV